MYYFGGVPNAIITDNLKSAVIKSSRYEPTLNEAFRDFVGHYTMAALPAAPYKPKYKALVEGAVKIIYRTIYGSVNEKVYSSIELLNCSIRTALEEHNNRLLTNRPYSRRELFEEIERGTLNSLPQRKYEIKRRNLATVMKNNYVCLAEDKHYYSVPYRFIGKKVTMLYTQNEYIIGLLGIKQHPEQSSRSCQGVLSFAARAGKERLNNACKRALQYGDFGYHTIRTILEKGLDFNTESELSEDKTLPSHNNIRGKNYYK